MLGINFLFFSSIIILSKDTQPHVKGHGTLGKCLEWFNELYESRPRVKNNIEQAGFGHFVTLLERPSNDLVILHALAERWWDSTNTFHIRFGEMTMTPPDFAMITGISFDGDCITPAKDIHRDHALLNDLDRKSVV